MRRIVTALLLSLGLVAGGAGAAAAGSPSGNAVSQPRPVYVPGYTTPNAAGTACTVTISWTVDHPERVASYYVVLDTGVSTPAVPKKGNAVPGIAVSGTSYVIEQPVAVTDYYVSIIAKTTSGTWTTWGLWGFGGGSPTSC